MLGQTFRMQCFNDSDDLGEWLDPLGYEAFWEAVAPFALRLQSRRSCDEQIAAGIVEEDTVLIVLKSMARLELAERLRLRPRDRTPWRYLA